MRQGLCHVLLVLLLPAAAAAQSSREDGIRAFFTGDYERAAQLLGPLADNAQNPDGVASFLMAMLYQSGRGVGRNPFRACGLYLKTAAASGPFTDQAAQLARAMREEWGKGAEFCSATGTWRTPPPATFVLGPDHSVEFTPDRITVRYRGEEKRTTTGMLPDTVPLPVRYTPLDVSQPAPARRHFVQWFEWWHEAPGSWSLGWGLSEIVGLEFVPVTGERRLMSTDAAQPPAAIDVTTLARVRVSANGEAEWVITGGANPRTGVIPPRGPK